MEEKKRIKFNLSASSLNTYYESPLLFYLTYIAKVPDDTKVPVCYGLSGSIVHDALEKYAEKELTKEEVYTYFAEQWKENKLDTHKDLKGQVLNPEPYVIALSHGINLVEAHEDLVCEEDISFPLTESEDFQIGIRGFIDLQATDKEKKKVIIDYKTSNSIDEGENFKRQAKFYSMLINKKKGYIPEKTEFYYLKLGAKKEYSFTKEDLEELEAEIKRVAQEIISYGKNIRKYPVGKVFTVFNSKLKACEEEMARRREEGNQKKLDIF